MNPRHAHTSPLVVIATPALVVSVVAVVWALHHRLAAAVVIGGTVWVAGIVGGITAATAWVEERKARGEADERCEALEDECMRLHLELTEAQIRAGDIVHVPVLRPGFLRSVPTQRTHEPWPPAARAVEAEASPIHDDLAVETFVESIERWGVEAEDGAS